MPSPQSYGKSLASAFLKKEDWKIHYPDYCQIKEHGNLQAVLNSATSCQDISV